MRYLRMVFAAVLATVAYYVYGYLVYGRLIAYAYVPYTGVFRPGEVVVGYMPWGMGGTFLALLALTVLYARNYQEDHHLLEGAKFGLLVGLFVVGDFVVHDYVILNIGRELAVLQAAAAIPEWTLVGMIIALVYRP
jgi:hypothetical protein